MAVFKPAKEIKALVEEELYTACKKHMGKCTNLNTLKQELQTICDESYIHRRCPVWFKVHLKPIWCSKRVKIELESMYYEGVPVKDGD